MSHADDRKTDVRPAHLSGSFNAAQAPRNLPERTLGRDSGALLKYDRWFKYRMIFLLALVCAYLVKLIFFRDIALANFDIPADRVQWITTYINWRVCSAAVVTALYVFSYIRRWHFATISWVVTGIATMALISDYINVYSLVASEPPQWMFGMLALRVAAVGCLVINAINARRLPPRPLRR